MSPPGSSSHTPRREGGWRKREGRLGKGAWRRGLWGVGSGRLGPAGGFDGWCYCFGRGGRLVCSGSEACRRIGGIGGSSSLGKWDFLERMSLEICCSFAGKRADGLLAKDLPKRGLLMAEAL